MNDSIWARVLVSMGVTLVLYLVACYFFADMTGRPFSARALFSAWTWAKELSQIRETWPFFAAWTGFGLGVFLLVVPAWSKAMKLYGEARFASRREMRAAMLLGPHEGIILGKVSSGQKSEFIIAGGQEPVMVAAPTRSGKGQGIVIPNCVNWPGTLVNLDVKLENFTLSAGYRKAHGQDVYFWNPAARNSRTHRHNPFAYIDTSSPLCVDDVQQMATWLLPASADGKSAFWEGNSKQLFQAASLLVLFTEAPENRHLGTVQRYILHPDGPSYLLERLRLSIQKGIAIPHTATELAMRFCKLPPETREGVVGQYQSATELLNNPVTIASLSGHDFDLRELRKKRMTLYVCMTPQDRERLRPLVSLMFQQMLTLNTLELPSVPGAGDVPVLLLLDEFTSMGKIPAIESGVAYLSGYNIRLLTIVQNKSQLRSTYGADAAETLWANHPYKVVFRTASGESKEAKEISDALGTDTVNRTSRSTSFGLGKQGSGSQSVSDHGRPLLLPQEITGLPETDEVIFTPNTRPIHARKVVAHKDQRIARRTNHPAPEIPEQAIADWQSVAFTVEALRRYDDNHPSEAGEFLATGKRTDEGDISIFTPGEINEWIAQAGGEAMDQEASEAVATRMLQRLGVSL